jgi:hypothetical protein
MCALWIAEVDTTRRGAATQHGVSMLGPPDEFMPPTGHVFKPLHIPWHLSTAYGRCMQHHDNMFFALHICPVCE